MAIPAQQTQLPLLTPQQQAFQSQGLSSAQQLLKQLSGNQFDFAPIEQRARTDFSTKTIPSLLERFATLGGSGTRGSSGLQGALGSAASGLEESLAEMRERYGLQQQQLQQNLLGQLGQFGYQPAFQGIYEPEQPSGTQQFFGALGNTLLTLLPLAAAFIPGGQGLAAGAQLLPLLKQLFGGGEGITPTHHWPTPKLPPTPGQPSTGASNPLGALSGLGLSAKPLPRTSAYYQPPSGPQAGLSQTLGLLSGAGLNPLPPLAR